MQRLSVDESGVPVFIFRQSIEGISKERVTCRLAMDPYLVGPACNEPEL